MQTSLHILALVGELRKVAVGAEIIGTEYYKKERLLLLFFRRPSEKEKHALYFSFHPHHAGVSFVPASKLKLVSTDRPQALFTISKGECTEIIFPSLDRIFAIRASTSHGERVFVFVAIGPNGSVWMCDQSMHILGSLRGRDFNDGEQYQFRPSSERLDPRTLTAAQLALLLEKYPNPFRALEKGLSGISVVGAREILVRAGCESMPQEMLNESLIESIASICRELTARYETHEAGYVYQTKAGWEPFPFRLKSISDDPEKFKSFLLAIHATVIRKADTVKEDDTERRASDTIEQSIAKLSRLVTNLKRDIAVAADYDRWRQYGELLRIHHDKLKRGMSEITVENSMDQHSDPITIALDPSKSISEQAEIYFQKHRKGREGLELLERRMEIAQKEIAEWEKIRASLADDPNSAMQRFSTELSTAAKSKSTGSGSTIDTTPRLPYREYTLSTGARIYVGRDGADNDTTTFQHAKPFELWFHAQQCPGSHVILKFPNKSFVPSKIEIEETAAVAAFHSKARKNKLVPVIYTERKYVRKPRGAKPGLVVVDREKSVMVPPRDPSEPSE